MKSLLLFTVIAVAASTCYANSYSDVKEIGRIGNKALYVVIKEGFAGEDVKLLCEAYELTVGALENKEENDAISAYLTKRAEANEKTYHAFLGGERIKGSWNWIYSKKPIGPYTNWSGGSPDTGNYSKCIRVGPNGEWAATYCTELKGFPVCQKTI